MNHNEGRRRGLRSWGVELRSWVGRLSWIQKLVAALLSILGAIALILGVINGFYDLCEKVGICLFEKSVTFSPSYDQDFSNASTKDWLTSDDELGTNQLINGGYRIYAAPNADYRTLLLDVVGSPSDVRVEVDAVRIGDPPNDPAALPSSWGVVCRARRDLGDYYTLGVLRDGRPTIGKVDGNSDVVPLKSGSTDEAISDTTSHRIQGDCTGETLTLSVDDRKLLEVDDPDFEFGAVGLYAAYRGEHSPGVDVLFDNFSVSLAE